MVEITPRGVDLSHAAGPERAGGQGLDRNQRASGARAIHTLLTHPDLNGTVEMVVTFRPGEGAAPPVYEAWSRAGMVRFIRRIAARGYEYAVIETRGRNPLAAQAHDTLATLAGEYAAAGLLSDGDGTRLFLPSASLSYPFAYERIAQVFDTPDAPDLIVCPAADAAGKQPGQHGGLDVVQSRCPLIFAGPGIRSGRIQSAARQIDIAPTLARALGFPLTDGRDSSGRTSSERGVPPDVYLARQDGRVLDEALDVGAPARPRRAYIFLLDGMHNGELLARLDRPGDDLPNLRRLAARAALFPAGSVTNFPSITWPSHNTIGTGAWSGHHGIVNPVFYRRAERRVLDPQPRVFGTESLLMPEVETLYEAFQRVYGRWSPETPDGVLTAAINEPCTRGAQHASFENRLLGDREQLKALTAALKEEISPRWQADGQEGVHREAVVDARGLAQVLQLFADQTHPAPTFVFHELVLTDGASHDYGPHTPGVRAALDESDRCIGRVLAVLDAGGLFDETLFVITSDHGMAQQNLAVSGDQAAWLVGHGGIAGVACERFVYLHDLDIGIEQEAGRLIVTVFANDADTAGERVRLTDATATVMRGGVELTRATADADGRIVLDAPDADAELHLAADGYNPRVFRGDASEIVSDLAALLYRQ